MAEFVLLYGLYVGLQILKWILLVVFMYKYLMHICCLSFIIFFIGSFEDVQMVPSAEHKVQSSQARVEDWNLA